jgi:hypothetical protein
MEIQLTFSQAQFDKLQREFRFIPGASKKAMVSAINKTLPGIRTETVREVTKVYFIKASDVRSTMTVLKAYPSKVEGIIRSEGEALPLGKFKVTPNKPTKRRPRAGVRVSMRRDTSFTLEHAFIAVMSSSHKGVFERFERKAASERYQKRTGKGEVFARLKIREKPGLAVPSMIKDAGIQHRIQEAADERLGKNLDHEIYRILRGYGK